MEQEQPDSTGTAIPSEVDAALRHLYQVHGEPLLRFLTRRTDGDRQWAEDILQETMLRAWRNPGARNSDGRWSRAWIYTVAKHILIDQVRAAASRAQVVNDERVETYQRSEDFADRLTDQLSDAAKIRRAIGALTPQMQKTLEMVFYQGNTSAQAGQLLGVPAGTVKSRVFYALKTLRRLLDAEDYFPENGAEPAGRALATGSDATRRRVWVGTDIIGENRSLRPLSPTHHPVQSGNRLL